jgi:hypothetical protein|tara:strand:- start:82 stop:516 length:435 start_codon:yes stop_codon:yes gene_type:complete
MDKFTTVANNILNKTINSTQKVYEEGALINLQKLALQGKNADEILKILNIPDSEEARTAINYIVNIVKKDRYAGVEDQEMETELKDPLKDPKTKQGLEAIKLAAKLGVGPARNVFQRGEQQLAGAMSKKYGELAKIINNIKLDR